MQKVNPPGELSIKPVDQCYKFSYFFKGVPSERKNAPFSVRFLASFGDLKFRLKLRMLEREQKTEEIGEVVSVLVILSGWAIRSLTTTMLTEKGR